MIRSFKGRNTESIFSGKRVGGFPGDIQQRARRKLRMLDAARDLEDLRTPPSNRLEKLKGGRIGQYSIRINNQWRICFSWKEGGATGVEIVDYH
ncbi:MAG: type II toxin-antitoxin system RelE/ParE family toxin [Gammaproteobacteria bacterium]|nr:type II toxin-antitoxin system RelE/ParE family toxin [Gammaproteobacteria bacterium]